MLDKRIIYTKCMYNCLYPVESVGKAVSLQDGLYHVSSVGKADSRLVVIRLFQLTRHDVV